MLTFISNATTVVKFFSHINNILILEWIDIPVFWNVGKNTNKVLER